MSVVSYREILPRTYSHKLGEAPRGTSKWAITVSQPIGHQTAIDTVGIYHGTVHPEYAYLVCTDASVTETDRHHVEISYTWEVPEAGQELGFQPNPIARADVWSFSTGGAQVPALTYYNGTGNGDRRPLVNAANDYFEGLTRLEAEVRLTISGNRATFPSSVAASVTNAVNDVQRKVRCVVPFHFHIRLGRTGTVRLSTSANRRLGIEYGKSQGIAINVQFTNETPTHPYCMRSLEFNGCSDPVENIC